MTLRLLDAADTARALPWPGLIDALRAMLARRREGLTASPERLAVPLAGGILLAMPATDGEFASAKLVTICPENPTRGLPSLLGEVLLMRADTGERLLMLDGPTLTARRTAAMSALAAIELGAARLSAVKPKLHNAAPGDDTVEVNINAATGATTTRTMLLIGCAAQAQAHLEVFCQALDVSRVLVCSRNPKRAEAFAARARQYGIDCRAIESPAGALPEADIIVTATTSLEPVFQDDPGFSGFVAAVGAFRPEMCEVPAPLLERAHLYVDDLAGAPHEAGDFIRAGIDWNQVVALEDAIANRSAGTPEQTPQARGGAATPLHGAPIVFKSVGQALWDLAACRLAVETIGQLESRHFATPVSS